MPSKVFSAAIIGLDGQIIEIETEVSYGLRRFEIVGLADKTVEESKERVGAALKSAGFQSPHQQPQRVLVNLAPADLKKEGSLYDLPIALGYLTASKQLQFEPANKILVGELALDGTLRPIKGGLVFALACQQKGWTELILPRANAAEAGLVRGIKVIGLGSLKEVISYLEGRSQPSPLAADTDYFNAVSTKTVDLAWIKGQHLAKRALEIAAAGGHNILMEGPPGTGKTLLAKALPSILPPLSFEEALEVTKIYSIAGLLSEEKPLINQSPFRSPHHTASEAALIGGGNPPVPGEITLAHRGVLFLDEFPEFHRDVLESLRQPLEEGKIAVLRSRHRVVFPAKFMLLAAANPCPCGFLRDPEKECVCSPSQIAKYRRKLSGPLMDRLDLFVDVPQLKYEKLVAVDPEHSSVKIREKIQKARLAQAERFQKEDICLNSEINVPQIKKYCSIDTRSEGLLRKFVDGGRLSARGFHRVLKTSRTIADLEGAEKISFEHLSEALMYRTRRET